MLKSESRPERSQEKTPSRLGHVDVVCDVCPSHLCGRCVCRERRRDITVNAHRVTHLSATPLSTFFRFHFLLPTLKFFFFLLLEMPKTPE